MARQEHQENQSRFILTRLKAIEHNYSRYAEAYVRCAASEKELLA